MEVFAAETHFGRVLCKARIPPGAAASIPVCRAHVGAFFSHLSWWGGTEPLTKELGCCTTNAISNTELLEQVWPSQPAEGYSSCL